MWAPTRMLGVPADRWDPDADRVAVTSDAKGRFRLEGLGAGPTTIEAAATTYGRATRWGVRPGESVELFLLPGATISGTVRDEGGRPVANAAVRVLGDLPSSLIPPAERADGAGRFTFAGLEAGRYTVVAREGPRAPAVATVSVETRGDASADLTLGEGGFVTGRLADGHDRPLAGRVRVAGLDGQPLHPLIHDLVQVEAGADGRFALGPVPMGELQVEASAPGYSARTLETVLEGRSRTADLGEVVLETGLAIRGFVRDRQGLGVAGAAITGFGRSQGYERPLEATAADDGSFVLAGLKPGSFQVTARAPGYARAQVTVAAGADDVELTLDSGGAILGTVVDGRGQPVEGARVTAQSEPRDDEGGMAMAMADEGAGRFTLRDVRPGLYVLEARAPRHASGTLSGVRVTAGRTVDVGPVRLRAGGLVRGIVTDASNEPVPGASVRIETGTPRGLDTTAQTDGAGAFEIGGAPTGRFNVAARHPSFAPARVAGEIEAEGDTADVRIVMGRGGRVEGVVRRRAGQPFAGAQVVVTPDRRGPTPWDPGASRAPVSENGSFAAEHVTPGPSQVIVLAPVAASATGGGAAFQSVTQRDVGVVEGETAVVEIATREVLVTGRLTRSGEPVAGVTVAFRPLAGGMAFGGSGHAPAAPGPQPLAGTTREDGTYELIVFEPGAYHATRRSPDGVTSPLRDASRPPGPQGLALEVPDVAVHTIDFALGAATVAGIVVDAESGVPVPRAYVSFSHKGASGSAESAPTAGSASRSSRGKESCGPSPRASRRRSSP